jgi:predicted protein tyrosine phosphatase
LPTYYVCSRNQVAALTSKVGATHILSLLDPGVRPYLHPKTDRNNWLLIICCDVLKENEPNAPTREQVSKILDWGKQLPNDAVVIVHCEAGVSRSTAAALALMVQDTNNDIEQCIKRLIDVRPTAIPNPIISKYADELLNCNGKLYQAAEELSKKYLLKFYGPY